MVRAAGFGGPPLANGVPPPHPGAIPISSSLSADSADSSGSSGYNYPVYPYSMQAPYGAPAFVYPQMVMPGPMVGEMWLPPNMMHVSYPPPGGPYSEGFNRKFNSRGVAYPGNGQYGQQSTGPSRGYQNHRSGQQHGNSMGRSASMRPAGYSRSSSDPGIPLELRSELRPGDSSSAVKQPETSNAGDHPAKDEKEEAEDTAHHRTARKSNGGGAGGLGRGQNGTSNGNGGSHEKGRRDGNKHSSPRKPTDKKASPPAPEFNLDSDFPSLTAVCVYCSLDS